MSPRESYEDKLERLRERTLLPLLEDPTRNFVEAAARRWRFTYQELRRVAEVARDLEMWREEPLPEWWRRAADGVAVERGSKKRLLRELDDHMDRLAAAVKAYPEEGLESPLAPAARPTPLSLVERESAGTPFGLCPAASEKTVCCQLRTLDAVVGCPYGCSYCSIQTFGPGEAVVAADLRHRLEEIDLEPDRFYHVGTGQASDALVWGNRAGILDALCELASGHPRVLVELKTKSDRVEYFLEPRLPGEELPVNLVCSWSLNTDTLIANEEHGTASLESRLMAARRVADRGMKVAFHLHPLVYYRGWRQEYGGLAARVVELFEPHEVVFLSLGTVTLIRPVVKELRRRGGETKILQMETAPDPHGKLTYPDRVKIELYRHLLAAFTPWNGRVFTYLCMEKREIWEAVLGWAFESNEEFEAAMGEAVTKALGRG